jgi:hypothetical protein
VVVNTLRDAGGGTGAAGVRRYQGSGYPVPIRGSIILEN